MTSPYKYIYGPVHSWRLGRSLGVDPLTAGSKICNMDCIYCQLGKTAHIIKERKEYISKDDIVDEIKTIPLHFVDYITFSGRGEPTLAKNLGDMIRAVKTIRIEKIAVITNGLLFKNKDVCEDVREADFVLVKLDAGNQHDFEAIDQISDNFESVCKGIKNFRHSYRGKMALQVMLMDQNVDQVESIAKMARFIGADEVQLNTPLRPSGAKPIDRSRMERAKRSFVHMNVFSVFDAPLKEFTVMDEQATINRHGNFRKIRSTF